MRTSPRHWPLATRHWPADLADLGTLITIVGLALVMRFAASPALLPAVSSDEYRYALFADEVRRGLLARPGLDLSEVPAYHPLVPWLAGLVGAAAGGDLLQLGRGLQLTLNSLSIPVLYLLMRALGFNRAVGIGAAALLAVAPAYWGQAVAFWPDSQLTFLCLLYLICARRGVAEHEPAWAAISAVVLALAVLTKEHAAVLLAGPAVILAVQPSSTGALGRPASARRLRFALAQAGGLALAVGLGLAGWPLPPSSFLLTLVQPQGQSVGLTGLQTALEAEQAAAGAATGSTLPLLIASGLNLQGVGSALAGTGMSGLPVWLASLGLAWSAVQAPRSSLNLGLAAAVLASLGVMGWHSVEASARPVYAAIELVAMGAGGLAGLRLKPPSVARFPGLAALLITTLLFFALPLQDITISERQLFPALPALAAFAALGLWCVAATVVAAVVTRARRGLAETGLFGLGVMAVGLLWLPTAADVQAALAFQGYPGDPFFSQTSAGTRWLGLRQAEGWLQANLKPDDVLLTSFPKQVNWHAGRGLQGLRGTLFLDGEPWPHSGLLRDSLLLNAGIDVIVDVNRGSAEPNSQISLAFVRAYEWMRERPYLEEMYVAHSPDGTPSLYAFRMRGTSLDSAATSQPASSGLAGPEASVVRVSRADHDSVQPALAWAGDWYGLAWADGRDLGGIPQLYFAQVARTGLRLGPERRLTDTAMAAERPSLVWTGSAFGLAWEDRRHGLEEIYVARLAANGKLIGPSRRVTFAGQNGQHSTSPALAWTGAEFGLAFDRHVGAGKFEVFFRRLGESGEALGEEVRLSDSPRASRQPAVVWDGAGHVVAWKEASEDSGATVAASLSPEGGVQELWRLSERPLREGRPALAAAPGAIAIAWADDDGLQVSLLEAAEPRPAVAGSASASPAEKSSRSASNPALWFNGHDLLVAWQDESDGRPVVHARRLSTRGTPSGEPFSLTPYKTSGSLRPALASDGRTFGAAWSDRGWGWTEVAFALFTADGRILTRGPE